ncbi:hypothetical protein D3C85_1808790 [compost metagenome]
MLIYDGVVNPELNVPTKRLHRKAKVLTKLEIRPPTLYFFDLIEIEWRPPQTESARHCEPYRV